VTANQEQGPDQTAGARAIRIKRLTFRAWHRGTRDLDLLMGPFADRHLAGLSDQELDAFEVLLSANDVDVLAWLLDQRMPDPDADAALLAKIKAFLPDARKSWS